MNLKATYTDMSRPMRAFVVLAAWFALAGPLWWTTLKTYRAPLPLSELSFYEASAPTLHKPVVPVVLVPTPELGDIVAASQKVLNQRLAEYAVKNWTLGFTSEPTEGALVVHFKQSAKSSEGASFHVETAGREAHITYDLDLLQTGLVASMVVDVLLDQVYREELEWWMRPVASNSAASYSPQLHISLSVLSDGAPIAFQPAEFAARAAPLLEYINSNVANITFDSQVDHYARPGCQGDPVAEGDSSPRGASPHALTPADLSTFVNFAEWNLASTMPYPTLNFILYIGPQQIANSATNSFLVPQWGGVAIMPAVDIDKFFPIFQGHLLALLGAPSTPASLSLRLDALARVYTARGLRATAAALGSLERLVQSMQHIPIPRRVLENCNAALGYLRGALAAPSHTLAGLAFTHAQAAFFEKDMVSQTFFPDEHKMAVYLPLLAPVGMLLVQRYRGLGLFRDTQFRRELQRCDDAAKKAK